MQDQDDLFKNPVRNFHPILTDILTKSVVLRDLYVWGRNLGNMSLGAVSALNLNNQASDSKNIYKG